MDLTPEQLEQITNSVLEKAKSSMQKFLTKLVEDLDIPDTRQLATKKHVSDTIDNFKNGINEEITKLQAAIKTVADETKVEIQKLTPPKSKPWWGTILDFED